MDTKVIKEVAVSQGLPSIIQHNSKQAVAARDLYNHLGLNRSQFPRWAKKNIINNRFAEKGVDWCDIVSQGKPDYILTLDFAKKLAMLARTKRGEQVREYFLECERQALQAVKPRSQVDLLLESVQVLHAHEQELSAIKTRVHELEAKSTTSPGYYSIIGFSTLKRKHIDLKIAANLGAKAKAQCRSVGCLIGTIPDPRFGRVNTYPEEILESVFTEYFKAQ